MEDSHLMCCLCNFQASTEAELETHIDNSHSDIFNPGNLTFVKIEGDNFIPNQGRTYESQAQAPTNQIQTQASPYQSQTLAPNYQNQTQSVNYESNAQATTPSYQNKQYVQSQAQVQASHSYYQPQAYHQPPQITQTYFQPQTSTANNTHFYAQSQVVTSSDQAQQSKEVNNINESYNAILRQPSFFCPQCAFFTSKADVLDKHMIKSHTKEKSKNPHYQPQTQVQQGMIQPSTLNNVQQGLKPSKQVKAASQPPKKQRNPRQTGPESVGNNRGLNMSPQSNRPALETIKTENIHPVNSISLNRNTVTNNAKFIMASAIGLTILPPAKRAAQNQSTNIDLQTANAMTNKTTFPDTTQIAPQVATNLIQLVQTGSHQFNIELKGETVPSATGNYKRSHTADVIETNVPSNNNNNFKKTKQEPGRTHDQANDEAAAYMEAMSKHIKFF